MERLRSNHSFLTVVDVSKLSVRDMKNPPNLCRYCGLTFRDGDDVVILDESLAHPACVEGLSREELDRRVRRYMRGVDATSNVNGRAGFLI
jgi:hypothetical protein